MTALRVTAGQLKAPVGRPAGLQWGTIWGRWSGSSPVTTVLRGQTSRTGRALTCAARAFSGEPSTSSSNGSEGTLSPRVCILGGGFGGLYTVVKLESLMWPRGTKPQITLIDQGDRFVFKPLLYELLSGAASEDEVAPTFAQLLAPYPVSFRQAKVASVQLDHPTEEGGSTGGGTVLLNDGSAVLYDWLVVALGAETATFGVPGVRDCAVPFATYQDAVRLKSRLALLEANLQHPEVVVVGGGYAGVEVAAVLAEQLGGRGRIKLVTADADILATSPPGQREAARAALQDRGVAILAEAQVSELRKAAATGGSSSSTSTSAVTSGSSSSNGSERETGDLRKRLVYVKDRAGNVEILEADLVVWSAGQAPAPKVEGNSLSLPFPTNQRGATETDSTLRVRGHQNVFALGDIAMSSGSTAAGSSSSSQQLPATAQVAFQQADYAAWNIWASINKRPLLRFSYQHLGDMMSLGSTSGAVALPIPVPPPLSAAAQAGPLGQLLRAAGVKLTSSYGGASDGVTLEGPLAAVLRRAAYLYRQPTDQQRLRVAASWARQAVQEGQKLAAAVLAGRAPGSSSTSGGRSSS